VVLDKRLTVRDRHEGFVTGDVAKLGDMLEKLLKE
jgi:hypothetical protein